MQIIIGRCGQDSHALTLTDGQKTKDYPQSAEVPKSVSRQHASLEVNADGTWTLRNLKVQNVTYVRGCAAEVCNVTEQDKVELGVERFPLDWAAVVDFLPPQVDIRPLREVWESYNAAQMRLTIQQNRFNALRTGTGILSMLAMIVAAVMGVRSSGHGVNPVYFTIVAMAIVLSIYFFIKAYLDAAEVPVKRQQLTDQFQREYVCPKCGRFLGNQPYDQVALLNACPNPACRVAFKK